MRARTLTLLLPLAACQSIAAPPDAGVDGGSTCLADSDCGGRRCNPATHACVDCLAPSDCPASQPGCSQGACGACATASDCPGSEACVGGACRCSSSAACPADAPTCILDGGPGVCGCEGDGGCAGANEVCDPGRGLAGACVLACTAPDSGCPAGVGGPSYCDGASGLCVQCLTAAQCVDPEAPVCVAGACVRCGSDADCAALDAGTPRCSHDHLCVECTSPAQCPSDRIGCNGASGSCGSCAVDADCPAGLGCAGSGRCSPFCGTAAGGGSGCVACRTSADCVGASCDAGTCG